MKTISTHFLVDNSQLDLTSSDTRESLIFSTLSFVFTFSLINKKRISTSAPDINDPINSELRSINREGRDLQRYFIVVARTQLSRAYPVWISCALLYKKCVEIKNSLAAYLEKDRTNDRLKV